MLVCVTGATGHLGNALIRQLLSIGYRVRVLVRKSSMTNSINDLDVEIVLGDVTDPSSLSNAFKGTKQVFHLAGLVSIMPRMGTKMFDVNVRGTLNVINACEKNSVERLIYTSSIHAIPPSPESMITNETNVIDPDFVEGDYGKSKALATIEVIKSSQNGSLECVIVCPTGIIGPYDYHSSYIGRTISLYCSRKIPAYVSGGYDFVDVRDVSKAAVNLTNSSIHSERFILVSENLPYKEVFQEIARCLNKPIPNVVASKKMLEFAWRAALLKSIFTGKTPSITKDNSRTSSQEFYYDATKLKKTIDFEFININDSIKNAASYFLEL